MSEAANLVATLRAAGAVLTVQPGGQVLCSAPRGAVGGDLLGELKIRKEDLLVELAREAVAESARLHEDVYRITDEAKAARAAGDYMRASALFAEQRHLVEGPFWAAVQRVLAFPEAVLERLAPEQLPTEYEGPCQRCGSTTRWRRADGALMCTVCHPDPAAATALVLGIHFTPGREAEQHLEVKRDGRSLARVWT